MTSRSEALISREILALFPEYSLIDANKLLPGNIRVDFHFKDQKETDIFIEISNLKIDQKKLNQIINLYNSILNIEPPLKEFELIIIGPSVVKSVKDQIGALPIKLVTYEEIGISSSLLEQPHLTEKKKLSPTEASLVTRWESEKKTIIHASDVQNELKCKRNYAYFVLHKLQQKGWIERITGGLYQFIPLSYGYPDKIAPADPFIIATALVKPYYCSYYTSNSYYGFTTQIPFTFFVATRKKKQSIEWFGVNYKFIILSKHKFFGFINVKNFDIEVMMAEPEKSVVDSFDKPHYAGGVEQLARITWRALPYLNQNKLAKYALKMKSYSLIQRLGFIIDFLSVEGLVDPFPSNLRRRLLEKVGKTSIYLDRGREKKGKYSKEWLVVNNVPREELLSEIEIR